MLVRFRQEKGQYIAYFIDTRRVVEVNEIGKLILDLFFNQEKDIDTIVNIISTQFNISLTQAQNDTIEFLQQIKDEIEPTGFNVLEQKQLDMPLGVEFEITTSCNLRCKHCFQTEHPEVFVPTRRAIKIINILAKSGVFEVSLIGGEPLRHQGLLEIINACKQNQMAVNLVTNLTLINDQMLNQLSTIPRLTFLVSLDGVGEIHDIIRGKGVFKKVDKALRLLKTKGLSVEITFTVNSINISSYQQILNYCRQLNIPCNFNLFKPFRSEHKNLIPKPKDFFDLIVLLFTLRKNQGEKIGISNAAIVSKLLGLPPRNECRATRSGLVIDVNEKMITCPSLVAAGHYQGRELPSFDEHFLKRWKSHEIFEEFRNNGLKECQARAYIFNDNVQAKDPYGITSFTQYLEEEK